MVTWVRLPDWARKDLAACSALATEFVGTWATSTASAAAAAATCLAWNHSPYWTISMIQNSSAGMTTASWVAVSPASPRKRLTTTRERSARGCCWRCSWPRCR